MVRSLLVCSLVLVGLHASDALAAEVTHIPPFLRGNMDVRYDFEHLGGTFQEEGQTVGTRTWDTHLITYSVEFSPGPGVSIFTEIPQYAYTRINYPDARQMIYDPAIEAGTMLNTDSIGEGIPVEGSGLGGVWFGIRGTPYSEAFERRGNRATWLAEMAFRTADATNFYNVTDGQRGAGPGGSAMRLRMGFSALRHPAEPYLEAVYVRQAAYTADLYALDGSVMVSGATLADPDTIGVRGGTELIAYNNSVSEAFFRFDLRLGFEYRTWQTVQSGVLLPSVLTTSRGIPVTEDEYTKASVGLGMYYRAFKYMQFNLLGDVGYLPPHRIEHPYPILTGPDTVDVNAAFEMKILIR